MLRLSILLGLTFLIYNPTTTEASLSRTIRCRKICSRNGSKAKNCYKRCMKGTFVVQKTGRLNQKHRKGSTKRKMNSRAAAKKALQKLRKKAKKQKLRRKKQKKAKKAKKIKACIKKGLRKCHPRYFKKLPRKKRWKAAQQCRNNVSRKCNR